MNQSIKMTIVSLAVLLLFSCTQADQNTPNTEDASVPKVGLIMKSLANEFFVNMAEQAKLHQQTHPTQYELIVNGTKNESDLAQQVALIDQMIASGVDAIVIAPADSKAVVPALVRAIKAGIVVVNIDNRLDKNALQDYQVMVPFVGPDNEKGAYMVGQLAAESLNVGDDVILLEGIVSAINSQQRKNGFLRAIEEAQLNLLAVQSADWEQTKAAQVTSSLLIQHPSTKAIFAANDNMALGALAAVKRANLAHTPIIVGFDNIQAIQAHIASGDILASVDQFGGQLAIFGIEKALSAIKGESLEAVSETPIEVVSERTLK